MNQRQRAFCESYLASGNATAAAMEAGYSARTAYSSGQRLLKNVEVQEYLDRRNEEISEDSTAEVAEIRHFWTGILRDDMAKTADRLKASELLAKTYGVFLERFATEQRITSTRDSMKHLTEDELRSLIREFDDGNDVVVYIPDNGRDKVNERE